MATLPAVDPASPNPPLADDNADLDVDLLDFLQSLTPAQRMRRHEDALELVRALRRAGEKHYGVDPRHLAAAER